MNDETFRGSVPAGVSIAIDGPVASGKSTLGAALAKRLGYTYVDSGAVYRAVTLLALRRGTDVLDATALTAIARELDLHITQPTKEDGRYYTVFLDGEDVTWSIRSPQVEANVSAVAAHPDVRQVVNERLRHLVRPPGTVMVGRDIGTVVLPHADLKIYLTASTAARAQRRHAELAAREVTADYDTILQELRQRDAYDSGPLRPAEDAVHLSTDDVSVADEVAIVLQHLARARRGGRYRRKAVSQVRE